MLNILLLVAAPLLAATVRIRNSAQIQSLVEARDFPHAAVEFMKLRNVEQPLYNEYHWGGYLIWNLYPRYRVFIDGRADVYGDQLMDDYFRMHDGGKDWRKLLDDYEIQSVIVEPNTAIASLLRQDPTWQRAFEDNRAAIFVRLRG